MVRASATTYECRHSANCQTSWGLMATWTDTSGFNLGAATYPGLSRYVAPGATTVDLDRWEGGNGTVLPTNHACGGAKTGATTTTTTPPRTTTTTTAPTTTTTSTTHVTTTTT